MAKIVTPKIGILYQTSKIQNPFNKKIIKPVEKEINYANNPNSLFRKYAKLVTAFSNHQLGRDFLGIENSKKSIELLTPHGFHVLLEENQITQQYFATIYSRAVFSSKLYPALAQLDLYLPYIRDFNQALKLLFYMTGLIKQPEYFPTPLTQIYHTAFGNFYPDPNPETTTVDGRVWRQRTSGVDAEVFGTIRGGTGTNADNTSSDTNWAALQASNGGGDTDKYVVLLRGILLFDSSSLPDSATIIDATISIQGTVKNNLLGSTNLHICSSTPASNTSLVTSDYSQLGSTSYGNVTYANYSVSAYNDISLNSSGLSNISLTGVSKFGTRTEWDINNTTTGLTWSNNNPTNFQGYFAEQTGTSSDPKLAGNYTTTSTSTSTTSTSSSTSTTSTSTSSSTTTSTSTSTSTSTTSTSSSTSTTSTSTSTSSSTSTSTSSSTSSSTTVSGTTTSTSSSTTTSTSTSTSTTSTSSSTTSTSSSTTTTLFMNYFEVDEGEGGGTQEMYFVVDEGTLQ